jgi:hypothetical protein
MNRAEAGTRKYRFTRDLLQSYFWLLSAGISYPEQTATQLRAIWRDGLMAGGNADYALLFQRSRAR